MKDQISFHGKQDTDEFCEKMNTIEFVKKFPAFGFPGVDEFTLRVHCIGS